jgi:hypothetical protein
MFIHQNLLKHVVLFIALIALGALSGSAVVSAQDLPDPIFLYIDTPDSGSEVLPYFALSGWAVDTREGANKGPGISLIQIYAGSECEGDLLAEAPLAVTRPDVVKYFSLDNSYLQSGFHVQLQQIPPQVTKLTLCGLSTHTGLYEVTASVDIMVQERLLTIEQPEPDSEVSLPFTVSGWGMYLSEEDDIATVTIHEGNNCENPTIASGALTETREDAATLITSDEHYFDSGFSIELRRVPFDLTRLVVCARDQAGEVIIQEAVSVQLNIPDILFDLKLPNEDADEDTETESTIYDSFTVEGWAVDTRAEAENGTGISEVSIFRSENCDENRQVTTLSFSTTPEVRDIMDDYGLDTSFHASHFSLPLTRLISGELVFTACARSTVTGNYEKLETFKIVTHRKIPSRKESYTLFGVILVCVAFFTRYLSKQAP